MQTSPLWARISSALNPPIALVLALLLVVSSGCSRLKPAPATRQSATPPPSTALSQGRLQEVAPPAAATALAERLAERSPQVAIVAPADDSLLPEGPWTLELRVSDWPLADAGSLGIGPHLVVQLDQQEPLRISRPEEAASVAMPELQPGSHRVTVYAARPWGEAVKSPGAMRQIRLHRVGRNTAELPARGSAQLIVASPDGLQQAEPVLIDWLLLDAPLQHLRDDDARWRLRVSVNGDSFLVDRQTPLWLKGFRRGSNAVQLELLDGRGEPLNPPFNSLVREVVIGGGDRPSWQRPSLSSRELALLSGERPVEVPATAIQEPKAMDAAQEPAPVAEAPAPAEPPAAEAQLEADDTDTPPAETATEPPAAPVAEDTQAEATGEPASPPAMEASPTSQPVPASDQSAESETEPAVAGPAPAVAAAPEPEAPVPPKPAPIATPTDEASTPPAPQDDAPAGRISAGTSLSGSARDQVNADGSLLKPKGRGPLAGLREKLGG